MAAESGSSTVCGVSAKTSDRLNYKTLFNTEGSCITMVEGSNLSVTNPSNIISLVDNFNQVVIIQ